MQMHYTHYLLLALMWAGSPALLAMDKPDPKDHPFNDTQPQGLEGESLTLKTVDGTSFNNYAVGPEDAQAGVLVIHEWWGLNDHVRKQADRLAAEGYRVLAIDLYNVNVTDDPQRAGELMEAVDQDEANAKFEAAIDYLASGDRKLATLGWCFGGGQSLQATLVDPDAVSATVIYYGQLVTDIDALETLEAPVLGIFARQDGWITPDKVAAFEEVMEEANQSLEVHMYDADHAFANPSSPVYDSAAARDAWQVTQAFLADNLK